jgi:transposase InsO family protein
MSPFIRLEWLLSLLLEEIAMPWKETTVYEERMKFVIAWKQGDWTMSDLCREFGISRVTGYKYLEQYEKYGIEGLMDKSKAPKFQAFAVDEDMIRRILLCREEHKTWGARKILASLKCQYHRTKEWPCPATVGRILKRNGMIKPRKRRIRTIVKTSPLCHATSPNDVWCADYKGHFTVGDGDRCDPLTVTDAYSRFLLGCKIVKKTDTVNTKDVFTSIFREYGIPYAIRTDNGTPFASKSIAGLSQLSVWWMKLGINLERIEPGKPQQNSRHERMHKTLKEGTALPPRSSLEAQQNAFDRFRNEYNYERPHEALDDHFPSEFYQYSKREFPEKLEEVAYPTNMAVEVVSDVGTINYKGHRMFISAALIDEPVGLEDIDDRHYRIYFCTSVIGIIDGFTGKVLQYKNPVSIINENKS